MSVQWDGLYSWNVNNEDVISVLIDSFVTDNKLFVAFFLVSYDRNVSVRDVKLCLVFDEEIELLGVQLMELYQEHSTLALVFVRKKIEAFGLRVMDDLLDEWDVVQLIDIYPCFVYKVEVNSVLNRCNNGYLLIFTHQEIVRLSSQRHIEES